MGSNHPYYTHIKVRNDIELYFKNAPNVSVGGFVENYFEIMGNSHFCLIPEGTSSWTNHLYTSFFAGCIPIILSDKFVLPFQNHIPWERLTVRWPQNITGPELYAYVQDFVVNRFDELEATKKLIDEYQCWWRWYDMDRVSECSPYKAIFQDLALRSRQLPNYRHKFGWINEKENTRLMDDVANLRKMFAKHLSQTKGEAG